MTPSGRIGAAIAMADTAAAVAVNDDAVLVAAAAATVAVGVVDCICVDCWW